MLIGDKITLPLQFNLYREINWWRQTWLITRPWTMSSGEKWSRPPGEKHVLLRRWLPLKLPIWKSKGPRLRSGWPVIGCRCKLPVGNWRRLVAKMINRGREYERSGVVWLPSKHVLGDYYSIKVLRHARYMPLYYGLSGYYHCVCILLINVAYTRLWSTFK